MAGTRFPERATRITPQRTSVRAQVECEIVTVTSTQAYQRKITLPTMLKCLKGEKNKLPWHGTT